MWWLAAPNRFCFVHLVKFPICAYKTSRAHSSRMKSSIQRNGKKSHCHCIVVVFCSGVLLLLLKLFNSFSRAMRCVGGGLHITVYRKTETTGRRTRHLQHFNLEQLKHIHTLTLTLPLTFSKEKPNRSRPLPPPVLSKV